MASIKVSDNCPDGCLIGNAAASKVGFFGATPVVQQTSATVVVLSTTDCGGAADATALRDAVNTIRTDLVNLGLAA